MKKYNPILVAGLPYVLLTIGYIILRFSYQTPDERLDNTLKIFIPVLFIGLALMLVGYLIFFWWLITSAKTLRSLTNTDIPIFLILFIPIVNYYWYWKYSKAVEIYTKGRIQTVLGFILLALLGPIGAGILQDTYNKIIDGKIKLPDSEQTPPTSPPVPPTT